MRQWRYFDTFEEALPEYLEKKRTWTRGPVHLIHGGGIGNLYGGARWAVALDDQMPEPRHVCLSCEWYLPVSGCRNKRKGAYATQRRMVTECHGLKSTDFVEEPIPPTKGDVFVAHIQGHLDDDIHSQRLPTDRGTVICKICGKDVDTIYQEETK